MIRLACSVFALAMLGFRAFAGDPPDYATDVMPLLKQHCHKCHADGKAKGGLSVTDRAALVRGGDTGPAIDEKKLAESLILRALSYSGEPKMPPAGKLPEKDIDTLRRWVLAGAAMPAGQAAAPAPHRAEPAKAWAYPPLRPVTPPRVDTNGIVRTPIDQFIAAKLAEKNLKPNPAAEPLALIRRMTYDLTGLPPSPADVEAFVAAFKVDAAKATDDLIERLLASPHYGEKWGRHWLDVVRFAESNGYERDGDKPNSWRYRDYVIRSFNADKPYDRFIIEQLAGDELPATDADSIIATGYYRLGLWDDEPVDPLQALFDGYDDYVTTTAQTFLGVTLNCSRCHDHKIDPFPQSDYYRMVAFFRDIKPFSSTRDVRSKYNQTDISPPAMRAKYEAELTARQQRIDELARQMKPIEDEAIARMPPADQLAVQDGKRDEIVKKVPGLLTDDQKVAYEKLRAELNALRRKPRPAQDLALSVNNCDVRPKPMHVMIRGNPHSPAARVEPGFPAALGGGDPTIPAPPANAKSSGRRTVLARWIASADNPMTARVMVNRVWAWHFGRGIVGTPSDFGKFGESPSHPELLDWLAGEFIRSGWSVKQLHRLILRSHVYLQSAATPPDALAADPADRLLARFPMRRLLAEEVRDTVLDVSGLLNRAMHGKSVYPPIPKEVLAGQSMPGDGWHTSPPEQANRRSVYVYVKRSLQLPILATHDQADTDTTCPGRYTTTVPTQALGMLNGKFIHESASAMARRLEREHPGDRAGQIRRAIQLTTGRTPNDREVAQDSALIARLERDEQADAGTALQRYCLIVLNANETVYLD